MKKMRTVFFLIALSVTVCASDWQSEYDNMLCSDRQIKKTVREHIRFHQTHTDLWSDCPMYLVFRMRENIGFQGTGNEWLIFNLKGGLE